MSSGSYKVFSPGGNFIGAYNSEKLAIAIDKVGRALTAEEFDNLMGITKESTTFENYEKPIKQYEFDLIRGDGHSDQDWELFCNGLDMATELLELHYLDKRGVQKDFFQNKKREFDNLFVINEKQEI